MKKGECRKRERIIMSYDLSSDPVSLLCLVRSWKHFMSQWVWRSGFDAEKERDDQQPPPWSVM
jgi:hypothetical protein